LENLVHENVEDQACVFLESIRRSGQQQICDDIIKQLLQYQQCRASHIVRNVVVQDEYRNSFFIFELF